MAIRENDFEGSYVPDHGWGNGYVGVPSNHPLFGKMTDHRVIVSDEDVIEFNGNYLAMFFDLLTEEHGVRLDLLIPAHCGITFANDHLPPNSKIIGEVQEKEEKYWWFGFDTCHCRDNEYNCNFDYVVDVTNNMRAFLEMYTEVEQNINTSDYAIRTK